MHTTAPTYEEQCRAVCAALGVEFDPYYQSHMAVDLILAVQRLLASDRALKEACTMAEDYLTMQTPAFAAKYGLDPAAPRKLDTLLPTLRAAIRKAETRPE